MAQIEKYIFGKLRCQTFIYNSIRCNVTIIDYKERVVPLFVVKIRMKPLLHEYYKVEKRINADAGKNENGPNVLEWLSGSGSIPRHLSTVIDFDLLVFIYSIISLVWKVFNAEQKFENV